MGSPSNILEELYSSSPTAIVELFHLDLRPIADFYNIPENLLDFYFHSGTNELEQDVVWQGNTYIRYPVQMSDTSMSIEGQLPRPKVTISNLGGSIGPMLHLWGDLIKADFNRIRTFVKFLDAANFADGNPDKDPNAYFPIDSYRIDRKSGENRESVELELAVPWDVEGIKLPRRQILANVCPWKYRQRGPESGCGYLGKAVADERDNLLNPADYGGDMNSPEAWAADKCGKRVTSCRLRWGSNNYWDTDHNGVIDATWAMPYGGFPTSGVFSRQV
jgi:lambda family phage minor tail protein L